VLAVVSAGAGIAGLTLAMVSKNQPVTGDSIPKRELHMAGRGPQPKNPSRRAGHSKDPHSTTVLEMERAVQPELPSVMPDGEPWPELTREWWAMWGRSPLSNEFGESDWNELRDTAILHGRLWRGDPRVAPELRLRVAKFGATPEDRARLRIQFAHADEADAKRPDATPGERRPLMALPEVG
jgi:hypothetical protein